MDLASASWGPPNRCAHVSEIAIVFFFSALFYHEMEWVQQSRVVDFWESEMYTVVYLFVALLSCYLLLLLIYYCKARL